MPGLAQWMQSRWDRVRDLAHAFRMAWVATGSVLAGFVLLGFAPQAQDLFLEVRGSFGAGVRFWVIFYLAALLVWAVPVYMSSRWLLWQCRPEARPHEDARPVEVLPSRLVPALLAAGCMASLALGQMLAMLNVPDIVDVNEIEFQLAALKDERATLCAAGASPACIFAVVRHVGIASLWFLSAWGIGPEGMILGFYLCLGGLIAWWLIGRVLARGMTRSALRSGLLVVWWAVTLVALPAVAVLSMMFAGLLWEEAQRPYTLVHLAVVPGVSALLAYLIWTALRPRAGGGSGLLPVWLARRAGVGEAELEGWFIWRIVEPVHLAFAGLGVVATILLFFQDPLAISVTVHRSLMLPFLLGPLVPVLTQLTHWSVRLRASLLIGLVAALGLVSALAGESHKVRTVPMAAGSPPRQDLTAAVEHWKRANGCEQRVDECPAPVIVAAAGGASRAAFLVGGLIGKLIDERSLPMAAGGEMRPLLPFENQLFAISGVSGGSLGAVVAYAALADRDVTSPPCRDGLWQKDTQWFRAALPQLPANLTPHESWRSCLEQVLAGDFLSPVFVRMVGNDLIGIGADRAIALEHAWESRYRALTGLDTISRSLSEIRQSAIAKGRWLPVLMLNGTSVSTGRRIVTSDVELVVRGGKDAAVTRVERILVDAYDLHALLESPAVAARDPAAVALPMWRPMPQPERADVRLSTAATMSARFPVISPHGSITTAAGRIVDRVVDGGYYENFGATTALELARTLKQRFGLTPMAILVNNEPTTLPMDCIDEGGQYTEAVRTPQRTWVSTISSPLGAVANTRGARGTYSAVELCTFVNSDTTNGAMAFVTVKPTGNKPLSMSWWLSKHVQQYLDLHLSAEPGREPLTTRERDFMQVNEAAMRMIQSRRLSP